MMQHPPAPYQPMMHQPPPPHQQYPLHQHGPHVQLPPPQHPHPNMAMPPHHYRPHPQQQQQQHPMPPQQQQPQHPQMDMRPQHPQQQPPQMQPKQPSHQSPHQSRSSSQQSQQQQHSASPQQLAAAQHAPALSKQSSTASTASTTAASSRRNTQNSAAHGINGQPPAGAVNSVSGFISKIFKMVSEPVSDHIVCWNDRGDSFVVKNEFEFASVIMKQYFRHQNFSSFVRQLNFYGFHKRSHSASAAFTSFYHPYFKKDQPHLLHQIQRKSTDPLKSQTNIANNKEVKDTVSSLQSQLTMLKQEVQQQRQDHLRLVDAVSRYLSTKGISPAILMPAVTGSTLANSLLSPLPDIGSQLLTSSMTPPGMSTRGESVTSAGSGRKGGKRQRLGDKKANLSVDAVSVKNESQPHSAGVFETHSGSHLSHLQSVMSLPLLHPMQGNSQLSHLMAHHAFNGSTPNPALDVNNDDDWSNDPTVVDIDTGMDDHHNQQATTVASNSSSSQYGVDHDSHSGHSSGEYDSSIPSLPMDDASDFMHSSGDASEHENNAHNGNRQSRSNAARHSHSLSAPSNSMNHHNVRVSIDTPAVVSHHTGGAQLVNLSTPRGTTPKDHMGLKVGGDDLPVSPFWREY